MMPPCCCTPRGFVWRFTRFRRSMTTRSLVGEDAQHLAGLAPLLAGDDDDGVVLAQSLDRHAHSTSGASEMIFMNRFARSSRATGPKMRVPIGSRALSISTAELVSKRM